MMATGKRLDQSPYLRRLAMERASLGRRNFDEPILSRNPKTGISLNLPVSNCHPTKYCSGCCYACSGPIAFLWAVDKSIAIDRWIREDPDWAADKAAREARGEPIRIAGSGDSRPEYIPFYRRLVDHHGIRLFGFTKRPDVWEACQSIGVQLMFSVDPSMDDKRLAFARRSVPRHRRAYCRRPMDPDWSNWVGVTFPEHGSGRDVDDVAESRTDCPALRSHVVCKNCRRCYGDQVRK